MADEHEVDMPENAEQEQPGSESGSDSLESPSDQLLADGAAEDQDKVVNPEDASEADAEAAMLAMLQEDAANMDSGQPADSPDDMMAMLDNLPQEKAHGSADKINFGSASASKAQFQQLQEAAGRPAPQSIDLLMDVNLPISIELGRTRMSIQDILALGPGSVVELNKLAGEPVDLLVNQKVVARGEVVVIDENFGVRITQLLTPEERLRALGEDYA